MHGNTKLADHLAQLHNTSRSRHSVIKTLNTKGGAFRARLWRPGFDQMNHIVMLHACSYDAARHVSFKYSSSARNCKSCPRAATHLGPHHSWQRLSRP